MKLRCSRSVGGRYLCSGITQSEVRDPGWHTSSAAALQRSARTRSTPPARRYVVVITAIGKDHTLVVSVAAAIGQCGRRTRYIHDVVRRAHIVQDLLDRRKVRVTAPRSPALFTTNILMSMVGDGHEIGRVEDALTHPVFELRYGPIVP